MEIIEYVEKLVQALTSGAETGIDNIKYVIGSTDGECVCNQTPNTAEEGQLIINYDPGTKTGYYSFIRRRNGMLVMVDIEEDNLTVYVGTDEKMFDEPYILNFKNVEDDDWQVRAFLCVVTHNPNQIINDQVASLLNDIGITLRAAGITQENSTMLMSLSVYFGGL